MLEVIALAVLLVTLAYAAAQRAVAATAGAPPGRITAPRFGRIELALYAALAVSVVALALTGFIGYLMRGEVRGLLLLGHMLAGGLFVVALPLFLLALAEAARFDRAAGGPLRPSEKALFWLAMAAGAVSQATIMVTMLPLLDTPTMETMLSIHHYSGLVMVLLAGPHLYLASRRRAASTG